MGRIGWCVVFVVLALALRARGQNYSERIPADAVGYVGWAGAESLGQAYSVSNLRGMLEQSSLPQYIRQTLPQVLKEQIAGDDVPTAMQLKWEWSAAKIFAEHPSALYVGPVDWSNRLKPQPRLGVICNAGEDGTELVSDLQSLASQSQGLALPLKAIRQDDGVVVAAYGPLDNDEMAALMGTAPGGLAAKQEFSGAIKQVQAKPPLCAYVDFEALLKQVDTWSAATQTPDEHRWQAAILDAVGARSLRQGVYAAGFDGRQWKESVFIAMPERHGMLKLLESKPIPADIWTLAPKDAISVQVVQFDGAAALTRLRESLERIDRQTAQEFEMALIQAHNSLMVDTQRELLAPLGTTWMIYEAPPGADGAAMGPVLVSPLRDAATMRRTIHTLESVAVQEGADINQERKNGIDYAYVALPKVTLAWSVIDDDLIVGQPAGLLAAVGQVRSHDTSIWDNNDFHAVRRQLGSPEKASALAYVNLAQVYPEAVESANKWIDIANRLGWNLPENLFPDAQKVAPLLSSCGAATWMDENGLHVQAVSAFPGAALLVGQNKAASYLMSWAGQAAFGDEFQEMLAEADADANADNLNSIAVGCWRYANDHRQAMPEHLAELIAEGQITPKQLIRPGSGTKPLRLTDALRAQARLDWHSIEDLVNQHCDYVYFGAGTWPEPDDSCILAMDNPLLDINSNGVQCVFGDGSVDMSDPPTLAQELYATEYAHWQNGWPELGLDLQAIMGAAMQQPGQTGQGN